MISKIKSSLEQLSESGIKPPPGTGVCANCLQRVPEEQLTRSADGLLYCTDACLGTVTLFKLIRFNPKGNAPRYSWAYHPELGKIKVEE